MRYAPPLFEIDALLAAVCVLAGLSCLLLWWRQRRQLTRALAEAQRRIQRLSASQQSLRDADRRRIARDLHDDLGQHLLALGLDAAALADAHPALRQPLSQLGDRIEQARRALRAIIADLPPEALQTGLQDALQRQVAQFSRLSGIPCRLDVENDALAAGTAGWAETVLYRVLQESLSNIVRHAQASEVSVGLCRRAHSLSLTVRDNGVGLPQPSARRGSGLRGIAQRVSEAGGRLDIASAPGLGTALTMSFPLP